MTSNPGNHDPGSASADALSATRRLLKPLVKFLIARGITLPALNQLLKSIYVEVAEEDFALDERKLTDRRVSLLTGVHRKDVQKLRNAAPIRNPVPGSVSIGTRLVSIWIDDPAYLDKKGHPRELAVKQEQKGSPSFEQLVEEVSKKDLHSRVVLDELIRLGIVSMTEKNTVKLNADAFVPNRSEQEKVWFFGENIASHMATGVHNLLDEQPSLLERSVSYSGLSEQDVQSLNDQSETLASEALKEINREARKLKKAREKKSDGGQRFTFGVYLHNRKQDADQDESTE